MRTLNRIAPALPVHAMKTFAATLPRATHWRQVSCAEHGCAEHAGGWVTAIDERTQLGQQQAGYIRTRSGRVFTETNAAGFTEFRFPPGQRCFREHRAPLDRPPIFVVRDGDWRGNPTGRSRTHTRGEHWVEEFAQHQDRIAHAIQRG